MLVVAGTRGVPAPASLVGDAVAARMRLALPAASRLNEFLTPYSSVSPVRARLLAAASLTGHVLRARRRGREPRAARLFLSGAEVVLLTVLAPPDDPSVHLGILTPSMLVGFEAAMTGPAAGVLEPLVVAAAAVAARRVRGAPVQATQLSWLWVLAVPGLVLWSVRRAREPAALLRDEAAAQADLSAVRLDALAAVAVHDQGLVHNLRDAALRMAVLEGTPPGSEAAAVWQAALHERLRGSRYLVTICRELEREQARTRPSLADRTYPEPVDASRLVRLDQTQADRLLAWLAAPDCPRGRVVLTALRERSGALTVLCAPGRHAVDLGGRVPELEPWAWDGGPVSLVVGALLLLPWGLERGPTRDRVLALSSAALLAATARAADVGNWGVSVWGRRAQLVVSGGVALSTARLGRLDRRRRAEKNDDGWVRLPWSAYGLMNLAANWVGLLTATEGGVVLLATAACLTRTWHVDGSSRGDRRVALVGMWPALAFTWRMSARTRDAARADLRRRLERLHELAGVEAVRERRRLAARALPILADLSTRLERLPGDLDAPTRAHVSHLLQEAKGACRMLST